MIAQLRGKLLELDERWLTLDVAGVGYEIEVAQSVLHRAPARGDEVHIYTHLVVREDAQLLYGFIDRSERDLFRAFIRLSGVGPKLALALISALDRRALATAVLNNDVGVLTRVPGVGKKTAERLLVELKNRVDELALTDVSAASVVVGAIEPAGTVATRVATSESVDALIALGYKPVQAQVAVRETVAELLANGVAPASEDIVRGCLKRFAQVPGAGGSDRRTSAPPT